MKKVQDRDISRAIGELRPLTPRQLQVLQEMAKGGTQWEAYHRLLNHDPSWHGSYMSGKRQMVYDLTFINFRQHLVNAYGRLQAHSLAEALTNLRRYDER